MCPPYFRAHTQVRPYENIENYTWDTTLVIGFQKGKADCAQIFPGPRRKHR
jgi:hypothetical protein